MSDDLFTEEKFEVELDAYVIPNDHNVFKLFPGQTYRLNKQILTTSLALLDIRGLEALADDPTEWDDEELRRLIAADRAFRDATAKNPTKRPASQDTKRLRFLRNLFFVAKVGDLVVVPLGKGLDGEVAIGEFDSEPGVLRRTIVQDGDETFETWGRSVRWRQSDIKRRHFSHELNNRLHVPTAVHLLEASYLEEIYLAAYGSFTYRDIYVASFPSSKETFTTADQANIGVWLNAISVIHQREIDGEPLSPAEAFNDLGLEESGVQLDLVRNSPLSAVLRTVGPLAFSALALYPAALEGKPLSSIVSVSGKTVAGATDKLPIVVPPDLAQIAKGLGLERYNAYLRGAKRMERGATIRPTARLKPLHRKRT